MFLIVLLSGRPVYDPNPLRPNPNPEKPVSGSCRVRGFGRTLTPLVGAVAKPELGLWMVTSYRGPHSCIPLATALDGRMMDCNFLAAKFVPLLQEKHGNNLSPRSFH